MGYRLRNESASIDKSSEHQDPSLSECTCPLLNLAFKFELRTLRAPQGLAPVQATNKIK